MKISIKILCALLTAVLVLPLVLNSCNSDKSGEKDKTEPLIICDGVSSDYVFVRTEKVNPSVVKAIFNARDSIKAQTGAELAINSDWVRPGDDIPTDTKEILVGATNRPESERAMAELKDGSFLIKVYGDRIAIVADGEKLLIDAINYFADTYVNSAKDAVFVPKDLVYLSTNSEYTPVTDNKNGTLTLKLDNFVIVYDNSNKQKYVGAVAKAFGKRVSDTYDSLGVTEDETVNKYEILFGECDRKEFKTIDQKLLLRDFYVYYKDNKLSVSASSIYGYESAINYLMGGFGKNGIIVSQSGEYKEYDYGNSAYADIFKNYDNPTMQGAWMVNVSHRGDYVTNKNPENSTAAYQSCVNNRVDVIETDLRKTKDGVWVICHDESIKRTTNGSGNVANLTYKQIQGYNLKAGQGGSNAAVTSYKMPTLTDIIKIGKGKCLFNLDKVAPEDFREVYDIFEKENAVDSAMFKTSALTADDLIDWYAELIEKGRKLPAFCPMLYSNTEAKAQSFKGLATMIETGNEHTKETLDTVLNEYGIRAMCLTALDNSRENVEYYTKLKNTGYTAIMTDRTVQLKEFIHGK